MIIGKLILKYLPFSFYHKIRSWYRQTIKFLTKPLSEKELTDLLTNRFELKKGDVVFVHSSVDKLNINFTPFRILSLLFEIVGDEGTLLFPAWHFTERAEEYLRKGKIFDVRKSPSALGLISELARRHPNAKRSLHPTTSIVAIGRQAEYLIKDHGTSVYPCDESSPFYKMMEFDAKIIGLGVSTEFLSFVHCPEDVMKDKFPFKTRSSEVFTAQTLDFNGQFVEIKTLVADKSIGKRDIPGFIKRNIQPIVAEDFSLRQNRFFIVNARALFVEFEKYAFKGNTIYSK
jgi:aminoglycoside 3-N-acetyltransferase